MKFKIEDVEVYFPYTFIYPEQYKYMRLLKYALDAGGPCLLEMPSGTGKTVSLLSMITAYMTTHPERTSKLIYCSRTVPEIEQVVEEARRVHAFRDAEMKENAPKQLTVAMSSRRNLCIHQKVCEEKDGKMVDSMCRDITASWVRERAKTHSGTEVCRFYEEFLKSGAQTVLHGVYSLSDLREYGKQHGICPYFLARHLLTICTTCIFSYQYLIDPKIADLVSRDFPNSATVVFDEAHNIDNVCIESLSITITMETLDAATRNVTKLIGEVQRAKGADTQKLRREYERLVDGLARSGNTAMADELRGDPVLPEDVVNEAVPGNIRRGEHFTGYLKRFIEYLKTRLREHKACSESPTRFLYDLMQGTTIEQKTLKFFSQRLSSLMRSLELADLTKFSPVAVVCEFATLVATYSKGFQIIMEPHSAVGAGGVRHTALQFCCLDASIALRPIVKGGRYRSVVITSGTLSPLDMYPRMLDFHPCLSERLTMTLVRECVCPQIVTRGNDQAPISSQMEVRDDTSVVRNFGGLLVEMSAVVPGTCATGTLLA
eukprot:TRINITY_DN3599_c0_g1_i1.p1 TRINITY_DN3599_c0_g1~~TRINITY_DN3599_c0_g1_i1.p1  ORF type:complete len:546 (+),score=120.34 TRINITY_DN3599_c0_g1_i1:21-1658(+)